jgi:hypothetical protein
LHPAPARGLLSGCIVQREGCPLSTHLLIRLAPKEVARARGRGWGFFAKFLPQSLNPHPIPTHAVISHNALQQANTRAGTGLACVTDLAHIRAGRCFQSAELIRFFFPSLAQGNNSQVDEGGTNLQKSDAISCLRQCLWEYLSEQLRLGPASVGASGPSLTVIRIHLDVCYCSGFCPAPVDHYGSKISALQSSQVLCFTLTPNVLFLYLKRSARLNQLTC